MAISILKILFLFCFSGLFLYPLDAACQKFQIPSLEEDKLLRRYDSLLQAEKIAGKRRDTVSLIEINMAMGRCFLVVGNEEVAEKYLLNGLAYASQSKDSVSMVIMNKYISSIKKNQEKWEQALFYLKNAYVILSSLSPSPRVRERLMTAQHPVYVQTLYQMSDIYAQLDSFDRAEYFAVQAYNIATNPFKEVSFFKAMREISLKKGDTEAEFGYLLKRIDLHEKNFKKNPSMIEIYGRLGKLLCQRGEEKQGIGFLEKSCMIEVDDYYRKFSHVVSAAGLLAPDGYLMPLEIRIDVLETLDSIYTKRNDIPALLETKTRLCSAVGLLVKAKQDMANIKTQNALYNVQLQYYLQQKDERYHALVKRVLYAFSSGILLIIIIVSFLYIRIKISNKNRAIVQLAEARNKQDKILNTDVLQKETPYRDLFLKMEAVISGDKLYLNPYLRRKEVAGVIGTNETYIYNAIKENTSWNNFMEYINSYRIALACELIKKQPGKKIENIATESGFISRQTFYRAFYQHLSMTPREYALAIKNNRSGN